MTTHMTEAVYDKLPEVRRVRRATKDLNLPSILSFLLNEMRFRLRDSAKYVLIPEGITSLIRFNQSTNLFALWRVEGLDRWLNLPSVKQLLTLPWLSNRKVTS